MPCIACYTNCFPPSPLSTLSFTAPPECETPQLNCGQYVFNKTYCIPPHYRCDMIDDCEDKSDEAQCSKYSTDSYATLNPPLLYQPPQAPLVPIPASLFAAASLLAFNTNLLTQQIFVSSSSSATRQPLLQGGNPPFPFPCACHS